MRDLFINICGRKIGCNFPVYIVAEMSANHNQDFEKAVEIIHAAKKAGANAVKLQTYTPNTITIDCDNECFKTGKGTAWEGRTLYDLYAEAHTPWDWQPKLKKVADSLGLDLFSTPFDCTAVDFLEKMQIPVYKIASFEVVDIPLIKKIAMTGKPIIMSTGMASLGEIDEAVRAAKDSGCTQLALLKCTSSYPALPEEMNLRTIPHLSAAFNVPVGLSDHNLDNAVTVASVALGACIIEKHFTLDRSIHGPDSSFSLEPEEFKSMVNAVRTVEKALGKICYEMSEREKISEIFRRSLFITEDMKTGEIFTKDNVKSIRPGYGLHTKYYDSVLGKAAKFDIKRGTPMNWDFIAGK